MTKSLIVLTGGIESSTITALAKSRGEDISPISHFSGNEAEYHAATKIAEYYNLGAVLKVDLSVQMNASREGGDFKSAVFPLVLTSAHYFALVTGCDKVYTGHEKAQSDGNSALNHFLAHYPAMMRCFHPQGQEISYETPFLGMSKQEVIVLAQSLKVPLELTWSCYHSGDIHCGTCNNCRHRHQAFLAAGVKDPTHYAQAM